MLYPTERAEPITNFDMIDQLIVLDGTWKYTKQLLKRNPWMQGLRAIRLEGELSGAFTSVRKPKFVEQVSTAEAVAVVLDHCGLTDPARAINSAVEGYAAMQRRFTAGRERIRDNAYVFTAPDKL
jgi:DTW domain-containing protein YfiP